MFSTPIAARTHRCPQTALLEFRSGEPERGRSVLEGVVANYPRRTDLWGLYLDQEVKVRAACGGLGRDCSVFV